MFLKRLWAKRGKRPLDLSNFTTQYEDSSMLVLTKAKEGDLCVVSFSGVGHGTGGINLQKPEFSSGGAFGSQIFIIDKRRTWGNALEWNRLYDIVAKFSSQQDIVCIGNSMGGFLAILASKRLGAHRVAAFAPQWTVDPKIIPTEHRWDKYTKSIDKFLFPDLQKSFSKNIEYAVIFGSSPEDSDQYELFHKYTAPSAGGNIRFLTIPDIGHNVAKHLKEKGLLSKIIFEILVGELDHTKLRELDLEYDLSRRVAIEDTRSQPVIL